MIRPEESIYAYWCLSENFGDKLTPYIIEKISGKKCLYSPPESDVRKYMVTGSILNWDVKNAVVWGCGIANNSDTIPDKDIRLVRGYISSYKTLLEHKDKQFSVGDPALLLPNLYKPRNKEKKYKISIFPHYVDIDIVMHTYSGMEDVCVINPLGDTEEIIDTIYNSEKVLSSSLHGLIVSDAYGIPNKWCKFSDRILGDDTKYVDYYMSINKDITYNSFADLRENTEKEKVFDVLCEKNKIPLDVNKIYNCCPFKPEVLWDILICTIPQREESFNKLYESLNSQIKRYGLDGQVRIMSNNDSIISIGQKRNHLLQNSIAKYTCFIDDDDEVSSTFIRDIYRALITNPDCVSLVGVITVNGNSPKKFKHSIKYDVYKEDAEAYYRPPNHLNTMRSNIAKKFVFPESNFGEDTDWAMQICNSGVLKTEYEIDKPYYFYKYLTQKDYGTSDKELDRDNSADIP